MRKKDVLILVFAAVSAVGVVVGGLTLWHEVQVDTRSGWIEIHNAMINLREQRSFVISQKSQAGAYSSGSPNQYEERMRDYSLAAAQLRGQLDRVNDPLLMELSTFLNENSQPAQWQSTEFEARFEEFEHRVAMKSRPK